MRRTAFRSWSALGAGLLFGVGLVVSGMADPRNVVGFLDVSGARGPWNPNLAAVMVGAIAVHAAGLRLGRRRRAFVVDGDGPWIDARLVGGAAIFGIGWGLAGYCPGPAIVSLGFASLGFASLGFGAARAWVFVGAMIVGVLLGEAASSWRTASGSSAAARGVSAC
jgi:uncharacterized membrane protein YedE/YeeE